MDRKGLIEMSVIIDTTMSEIDSVILYARCAANNCMIGNGWKIKELVMCNDCKHLKIVNKAPVYAVCELGRKMFMLFDVDTREWFCADGERKENG